MKMPSTAGQHKASAPTPRKISWSEFEKRYLTREDKYKYEWLNGVVEKTERDVNLQIFSIKVKLQVLFSTLCLKGRVNGLLINPSDTFFGANHRMPDLAYFTREQITRAAYGENQVPQFVIEVISKNDKINKNQLKIQDFFNAGVQVIWEILPAIQQVNVYHNADRSMKINQGEDLCSAAPVLPDFAMTVHAIFEKPDIS